MQLFFQFRLMLVNTKEAVAFPAIIRCAHRGGNKIKMALRKTCTHHSSLCDSCFLAQSYLCVSGLWSAEFLQHSEQ